ncbi:PAS domain S-box-containing protein [Halogeometricum rufum]|uniref:PAS domain S-box-containing protein n=1 Tax=Halogeometricum rufum TaxID=553469 RepID=A0A1I6IJF9_9EURY|nr:PAS domain S-box protein [Halogeometricum rufum]SFR66862.1 PAS domain S-box-containing protein [Halogeometricum rufum]
MESRPLTDPLRQTLDAFGAVGEPVTTPEVAERLDIGRRTAYARLERLVEDGRVETKKVGANARVWWRPVGDAPTATLGPSTAADSLVGEVLDDVEVGIFVLDESFDVVWVNGATERYFGLDRTAVLGANKRRLVTDRIAATVEDSASFADTVLATYDDNSSPQEFECHVTAADEREERWLEHRSEPIESGTYAGGRVELYYDVTERKRSERSRREDREVFESFVERVDEYAIFTLDTEGRVQTWNRGAERIKGYAQEDIVGEHVSTFYTAEDCAAGVPEENLAAAAERGSVEFEGWRVDADGDRFWANVAMWAIRDANGELEGYAKVTRDLTERRDRERQLRRERDLTDRLLETAPVRLAIFRPDGTVERTNAVAGRELGLDDAELETLRVEDLDLYDPDGEPIPTAEHPVSRVVETGEPVSDRLVQHDGSDGTRRWVSLTATPLFDDGTLERVVVAGKDVTELKRKERRLERQRDELDAELDEVFARIDDAFFALDEELRFVYLNEQAVTLMDLSGAGPVGEHVGNVIPTDTEVVAAFEEAFETQESVSVEEYHASLGRWFETHVYPSETGLSVYFRDVSRRKAHERELERYETIVETVPDGVYALDDEGRYALVNDAFCELTGYDSEDLLGRRPTLVEGREVHERANELGREILAGDRDDGTLQYSLQTAEGGEVAVEGNFTTYRYGDDAAGRAGVVRDVTARVERERELERRRERLRALNSLNEVVRGIAEAVIEQSTREEIEETVCDRLAAAEPYLFAWVGDVDPASQTVSLRSEAGVEGYLDGVTISVDSDDERSEGPTGRAIRTGEVQTTRDTVADVRHDPWRDHIEQYDFRSSAAIPITHEDTPYGVLNVYSDRPGAFEGEEYEMVGQLGEIVGHAIAAVERKHALMSDDVVELVFQIENVFESLGVDDATDAPIRLEHIVRVGDDKFVFFGRTTPEGVGTVEAMVESVPFYESVTVHDGGDERRFELRVSEPPVLAAISTLGGGVAEAVIEGGDYRLSVHLPPSADVRRVVETMTDAYPTTKLLKRRQLTKHSRAEERQVSTLTSDLTDRQRTALETAYYAGFFEWPRAVTGEDVAESLGVSPPTFHQHLRKAERKMFDAVFGSGMREST